MTTIGHGADADDGRHRAGGNQEPVHVHRDRPDVELPAVGRMTTR